MHSLPLLIYEDLLPTRDYLRDVTLVLGSVQRGYLPANEHDWQHGLQVSMRGISTQPFAAKDKDTRIMLDLVRHKVRLGETNWSLEEYAAPELLNNLKVIFAEHASGQAFEQPEFSEHAKYDAAQADAYAEVLWWMDARFRNFSDSLDTGLVSPILLYPHHFDLSLVWYPYDTDEQLNLGFSTGDETIAEPYIYITMYPEHADFGSVELPDEAYWQTKGFHGAVLLYPALQMSSNPEQLLIDFMTRTFSGAKRLLRA